MADTRYFWILAFLLGKFHRRNICGLVQMFGKRLHSVRRGIGLKVSKYVNDPIVAHGGVSLRIVNKG